MSVEDYKFVDTITKLGNRAVKKAIQRNKELGVPNVYSINGTIIYELPDGTITKEYDWE